MDYVNLTPDAVVFNDGRVFPPSGVVAKVTSSHRIVDKDICWQAFGEVKNLPDAEIGVRYIVSTTVLMALARSRPDVVAPAISHPNAIRDEKGQIVSVPCFEI